MGGGIGDIEFAGTYRIGFQANAEHLGFHAIHHPGQLFCKDLIQAILEPEPGPHTVRRDVFISIRHPYVAGGIGMQLFCKIGGDPAAGDPMLDPEAANGLVGTAEGQAIRSHGMAEEGGVKIQADAVFLGKVHPGRKMLRLQFVPIHFFARGKDGVRGVQVQPLGAGDQGKGQLQIRHELLGITGLAGIVAGGLDAPGEAAVGIEPHHIIPLPAMDANGDIGKGIQGFFNVYAYVSIHFFCLFKHGLTPLHEKIDMAIRPAWITQAEYRSSPE